jgi:HAD superfamily 5'-nucleotidase-like hydrolase
MLTLKAPPERELFVNRTLNLRGIRAIGYDMDYTLVHYRVDAWEALAYQHTKQKLLALGWPVEKLEYRPDLVIRGLVFDVELGNIVKTNRFGYVKRALHGTRPLDYDEQRQTYSREIVDLGLERYVFMNTLFSMSEGCLWAQLVDLMDAGALPSIRSYRDLYRRIRSSIDEAHFDGMLKAEIMAHPERFVDLDPDVGQALLDQKNAGKKLLLITNSEWGYTNFMLRYALDPFLPAHLKWRELFDVVIVGARKPEFFERRFPLFEIINEEGDLRPALKGIEPHGKYLGGSAGQVESYLRLSGDQILYVGDHIWGDVHVSKRMLRWRTALVLREIEDEVRAVEAFAPQQAELDTLMRKKEVLEHEYCLMRLEAERARAAANLGVGTASSGGLVGAPSLPAASGDTDLDDRLKARRAELVSLDETIAPLAKLASELGNATWGSLMRAGNDKSAIARQVERSADIYTSRVSNFLFQTPYRYLRSERGSLPHDRGGPGA